MNFQLLNLLIKHGMEFGHKPIRDCGLNNTEYLICSYAYAYRDCTQETAAQALHIDKTTAAKAIAALEGKGYITRRIDEHDRRKKLISVTSIGEEQIYEILHLYDRWLAKILCVLTQEEQKQFESYCERLLNAAMDLRNGNA